jgi:hypothetical protein
MKKLFVSFLFLTLGSGSSIFADAYQISVSVDMNALATLERLDAFGRDAGNDWEVLVMNANSPTEDRSFLGNLKLEKALLCLRNDSYVNSYNLTGDNPSCQENHAQDSPDGPLGPSINRVEIGEAHHG